MVGMAKLVIAPDCGSGGRGFESLYSPFPLSGYGEGIFFALIWKYLTKILISIRLIKILYFRLKSLARKVHRTYKTETKVKIAQKYLYTD